MSSGRLVRLFEATSASRNITHKMFDDTREVLLDEPQDQAEDATR